MIRYAPLAFWVVLITVLVLFLPLPFVGMAHAQNFLDQYDKPLPEAVLMDPGEFNQKTRLYEENAKAGSSLGYEIRLPKDWTAPTEGEGVGTALDEGFLGIIGRFYGPPSWTVRSRIEIRSYKLDYEMKVKEWMVQYLVSNGYSFQGMDVYNDQTAESAYVMMNNMDSYLIRSVAVINGKNLILVEYFLPLERYDEEKIQQTQVVKSFKLRNIIEDHAEKLTSFQFLDIATMQYPETWELKALPIRSVEFMSVQLFKFAVGQDEKKTRLDGRIEIELVSLFAADSIDFEMERYREGLSAQGLNATELIEEPALVTNPLFDFAETKVFKAVNNAEEGSDKLIDYELWQTAVSAEGYYYFVSLLTPTRDADYFLWTRNKNTYQLILNLIRPHSDEIEALGIAEDAPITIGE